MRKIGWGLKLMKIKVICHRNNHRKSQLKKAINILNGAQNYFHFELITTENSDVCVENRINWERFCNTRKAHPAEMMEHIIYITEKPFDDNWFSHEECSWAIITTYDWETRYAPPSLSTYIVYQVAQAAVSFVADLNEDMEMRMVHDRAEGCMFDFCARKPDIKLGMVGGTICPRCRSVLFQYGVEEKALSAVERILYYVRQEAIGRPILLDENAAFIVMRFSTNDENDNAYKYGIEPALAELNIKCRRADNAVTVGQLFEKVRNLIEKNRFIIVKVDSENLNVYFELGLAMGLDKDILLISEQNLVLQLPSDLKNWECLTYQKGNYEELKKNIVKFYQDNFYY